MFGYVFERTMMIKCKLGDLYTLTRYGSIGGIMKNDILSIIDLTKIYDNDNDIHTDFDVMVYNITKNRIDHNGYRLSWFSKI